MKIYTLHQTQVLPITLDEAWAFFSTPKNLDAITPPWMRFTITSGDPGPMYAGQIMTYKIELVPGVPQTWVTEIKHVQPRRMFVDEQRFGPYRFWHHKHMFEETGGGVLVTDLVHYALPFGPLGRVTKRIAVGRTLDKIFDYRKQVLTERFGE